jgi:hypothetical protein
MWARRYLSSIQELPLLNNLIPFAHTPHILLSQLAVEYHKRFDPIYSDARNRARGLGPFSYFYSYMAQVGCGPATAACGSGRAMAGCFAWRGWVVGGRLANLAETRHVRRAGWLKVAGVCVWHHRECQGRVTVYDTCPLSSECYSKVKRALEAHGAM